MIPKDLNFAIFVIMLAKSSFQSSYSGGDNGGTESVFKTIGRNVDVVLNRLDEFIDDDLQNTLKDISKSDQYSEECYGCQVAFTIAGHLFDYQNYTLSDLESNLLQICRDYFTGLGQPLQGSVICGGIITNYGPHIETIARLNNKAANVACLLLTYCSEDDNLELPPYEEITLPPEWYPQQDNDNVITHQNSLGPKSWVPLNLQTNVVKHMKEPRPRSLTDEGILRIAQLTDIHVDANYLEGSYSDCGLPVCCRKLSIVWPIGRIRAGPYGDWNCNVPPETTIKFIQKVQSFEPDIVLYTGDSPSHHLWQESLHGQMNATLWVAQQLAANIAEAPVYSTIGNHETFPSNLYHVEGRDTMELHEVFLDAYSDLSGFDYEQEESIRDAGYYTTLIRPGLRILSYNSNFGYRENWYNVLNDHTDHYANMTDFIEGTLMNAREFGEKVIIITHHPVGEGILEFDELITKLMTNFSDVIVFNTVGHKHKDEFRLFRDEEGEPRGIEFLAQSANSYSYVNPSVRLYYFDNETLELIDYEQHYMNLTDGTISFLYSATKEYGLPDLTPKSMVKFVLRMKSDVDLFRQFMRNRVSATGLEDDCWQSEACIDDVLCRLLTTTLHQWKECVKSGIVVPTTAPPDTTQTPPESTTEVTTPQEQSTTTPQEQTSTVQTTTSGVEQMHRSPQCSLFFLTLSLVCVNYYW